ncbi:MAG: OmpH family outer membrane protein [Bacteroidales bacterium]
MKKLSVILFVALFLAVAALFVLHFTSNKSKPATFITEAGIEIPEQAIAYVNIDTIIFNFDMFFDRREDLLGKQKKAETELTTRGTRYERDAKDFQEKVNKGLVTRATAAEMEQTLLQQQQELLNLRDRLQSDLYEEEQVMNRQILEYITKYLEANRSEYNYQYILGKSFGSVVLYSNEALDITRRVLEGLNRQYKTEKKK